MIEPKTLYRELDAILGMIDTDHPDRKLFQTLLNELNRRFKDTLRIHASYSYGVRGKTFTMIHSTEEERTSKVSRRLPLDSEFVQLILKHKSYLFEEPEIAAVLKEAESTATFPAAISVYSPYAQWLLVFEFDRQLPREEIFLFLNAVRTAVNYRLFSKSMRNELDRAVQIQKSLLPRSDLDVPGYEIIGQSRPAKLVGGDFFD